MFPVDHQSITFQASCVGATVRLERKDLIIREIIDSVAHFPEVVKCVSS